MDDRFYDERTVSAPRFWTLVAVMVLLIAAGIFFWNFPVALDVEPAGNLYESREVAVSDVVVRTATMFGHEDVLGSGFKVSSSEPDENGVVRVKVSYKYMSGSFDAKLVPIDSIKASYTGRLMQGERLKKDNVEIRVYYKDNTSYLIDGEYNLPDKITEATKIHIDTPFGATNLELDPVVATHVTAEYTDTLYPGDHLDDAKISVKAYFSDGSSVDLQDYELVNAPSTVNGNASVVVTSPYGNTTLELETHQVVSLNVKYLGDEEEELHVGDMVDTSLLSVEMVFDNGSTRPVYEYTVEGADEEGMVEAVPGLELVVNTEYGTGTVPLNVTAIESASMISDQQEYKPGDVLAPTGFSIQYSDGSQERLEVNEVTLSDDFYTPLSDGSNTRMFTYEGQECAITVTAVRDTKVSRALPGLQQELADSYKSYVSDDLIVTIRHYTWQNAAYYLTHVIMNSPSQIHAGLSYDDYGGERETPSHAAQRQGWVVGINASNFDYATGGGDTNMANVVIKNGQKMPDSQDTANGMEICLKKDGSIVPTRMGATVQALLDYGVTDTFTCGDTTLIVQGERVNEGIQSEQYKYPRTAIGMVEQGEYYIITADDGDYETGLSYDQVRDVMWDAGCTFAKCMDGGGSSSLVFQGELLNAPATGSERAVSDFIYFTDMEADLVIGDGLEYYDPDGEPGSTIFTGDSSQNDIVTTADGIAFEDETEDGITFAEMETGE